MNSIGDPLEANDMLKSATIYRNSEYNYIYVCYHCECSFTNILATLTHIETHFDAKVETKTHIVSDSSGKGDSRPENLECDGELRELQCLETDNKTKENVLMENGDRVMLSDGNEPYNEYTIVEYQHSKPNDEDAKKEFTNKYLLSQCHLCERKFSALTSLIIHMMKYHFSTSTLTCPHCSQNWTNEKTFSSHLQEHIDGNDTTYDALINTIKANHEATVEVDPDNVPRRKYKTKDVKICDICSSTFRTKEKLISHMRQHINQPKVKKFFFDCEKCERKIEGKFAFYAHQYGHLTNDDQVNAANDDCLQISLRNYLNDSVTCDESTDQPTYGCSICNQINVKQRYGAQRHIMQQHIYLIRTNKQKKFACEYCGRKFALSNNLRVHKRTHTLEKPFTCLVCNKSFAQSSYMRYHEKIHTMEQPHQCPICGKTFRTNHKLNFHIKMHANITTKCPICDKELKEYRLKLHIRNVHENEHRPYKCSVCLQAFKTAKTLRTHAYRHNDEKQFECRHHCKEKFTSSSSRRAHERSKHEAP